MKVSGTKLPKRASPTENHWSKNSRHRERLLSRCRLLTMNKPKNQLIIVEGLTGLGKSTVAHFIERQLQYNGIEAIRIHEGEDPHPVSIDVDPDISSFMTESLKKWEKLVTQIQDSDAVTVIEASFFNNLIETLYAHYLDRATIFKFGMELQQVIKPARPALINLTHPDIPSALEENFRNRGPDFQDFVIQFVAEQPIAKDRGWDDYAGMVKFWHEFIEITDALFRAYAIDKLSVDVSADDWAQSHRQLTEFLALSLVSDPQIDAEKAQKFVGVYQFKDGKQSNIQYKNGVLLTDIFMNVKTRLIPKSTSSFIVEKWHFELDFDIGSNGEVSSFEIGGRDVSYWKAVGYKASKVKS